MEFEWDLNKEAKNVEKHGISFVSAAKVMLEKHYEAKSDRNGEIRYLAVGKLDNRIIAVVYTKRGENYRIISARRAGKNEEAKYREYC